MRKLAIVLILAFGLCAACSIEPEEGQLECVDNSECPDQWFCDTDNLCYESDEPLVDTDSNSDPADETDTDTN